MADTITTSLDDLTFDAFALSEELEALISACEIIVADLSPSLEGTLEFLCLKRLTSMANNKTGEVMRTLKAIDQKILAQQSAGRAA